MRRIPTVAPATAARSATLARRRCATLPLPPGPDAAARATACAPLKAWRYVGVYGPS